MRDSHFLAVCQEGGVKTGTLIIIYKCNKYPEVNFTMIISYLYEYAVPIALAVAYIGIGVFSMSIITGKWF